MRIFKIHLTLTEQQWLVADRAATATKRVNFFPGDFVQEIVDRELAKLYLQSDSERRWHDIWQAVCEMNSHYSLSTAELKFLIDYAIELPAGSEVLELGVCHGRTLAALGLAAKGSEVTGIDHFGLEGSPFAVREQLRRMGLGGVQLTVGDTRVVPWGKPLDLLLIDAGHDEANVSRDVAKYVPFVKPGGMCFFHDWDDPYRAESPHEAVRRHAEAACGDWEDLGLVGGLKGFRRPL